jgi:small ligand-binding sensory domain FIST
MLCLPYAYVFSSTKLVIRAEQDLPGSGGEGGEGRGGGQGGEMTQTMYAYVNKCIKK